VVWWRGGGGAGWGGGGGGGQLGGYLLLENACLTCLRGLLACLVVSHASPAWLVCHVMPQLSCLASLLECANAAFKTPEQRAGLGALLGGVLSPIFQSLAITHNNDVEMVSTHVQAIKMCVQATCTNPMTPVCRLWLHELLALASGSAVALVLFVLLLLLLLLLVFWCWVG